MYIRYLIFVLHVLFTTTLAHRVGLDFKEDPGKLCFNPKLIFSGPSLARLGASLNFAGHQCVNSGVKNTGTLKIVMAAPPISLHEG